MISSSERIGVAPSVMSTTLSDSRYASGLSSTASITENIAVVAPMPSASDKIATAANPGLFRNCRKL